MENLHKPLIDELPAKLINPERFMQLEMLGWGGEIAINNVIQVPFEQRRLERDASIIA